MGVDLLPSAPRLANSFLHLGREPPQMKIARHRLNPRIGYADQRLTEVRVGKANGFKHGTRRGAVAPLSNFTAAMLEVHRCRKITKLRPTPSKMCRKTATSLDIRQK